MFKKDIDAILERLQLSNDREEKRNLLKELNVCDTCFENPTVSSKEKAIATARKLNILRFSTLSSTSGKVLL